MSRHLQSRFIRVRRSTIASVGTLLPSNEIDFAKMLARRLLAGNFVTPRKVTYILTNYLTFQYTGWFSPPFLQVPLEECHFCNKKYKSMAPQSEFMCFVYKFSVEMETIAYRFSSQKP